MNAISNLDNRIQVVVDDLVESPFLDKCREDVLAKIDDLRGRLSVSLPSNLVEMGKVCAEVDEILFPVLGNVEKNQAKCKDKELHAFYLKVHKARVDIKKMIIGIQSENDDWEKLDSNDTEGIKRIVSAFLGIPAVPYEKGSNEWNEVRQRLLNVSFSRDFSEMMGLRRILTFVGMNSIYDYLRLTFGDDYDLDCLESRKYRIDCSSRESLLASYKRDLDKALELPEVWPSPEDDAWLMYRARILNLNKKNFIAAAGRNLRQNKWFKSIYEVIIELYNDHFDVREVLEARMAPKRYRWRTREETLRNVRGRLTNNAPVPTVYSKRWFRDAARYSGMHAKDLVQSGLGAALIKNKWYSKLFDLLSDVFEDWEFPDWTFTMLGRLVFERLVESDFKDGITKDDHENVKAFLDGDIDLDDLIETFSSGSIFSARGDISAEETEQMVKDNFEKNLRVMGLDCPLKLSVLWKMSRRYAEMIKFVKSNLSSSSESAAE